MEFRLSRNATVLGSAIMLAGLVFMWDRLDHRRAPAVADATVALGATLDGAVLESLDGTRVPLSQVLDGHAALMVIASARAPETCADYYVEFRVVRQRWPHVKTIVVGTGPERDVFRAYFQERRLEDTALLDPPGALLDRLGLATAPVALLVDASGRVLFADARTSGRSSQYPVGRILRDLAVILGDTLP